MSEEDKNKEESKVVAKNIEEEIKSSYLTYAMSVIVSRALPDIKDGLKPVHRRILYSMHEMGLLHNRAPKKCARITGEVLGKYHPHGDQSIYDALVRLAQDFSLRYPLVIGQGNFGSIDGDPPAAMRYTEARMSKVAEDMLKDIDKETVSFKDNYDSSLKEPEVLPAQIPALLINGSSGIAVGMATNIPPHNMKEVCSAVIAYIDNMDIDVSGLMEHVKAPDFPTAGLIYGINGIRQAYETGRGRLTLRSRVKIEEKKGRQAIIVNEIPYQVNKSNLVIQIADLVKDKRIEGISELRDESDRDGVRIVIELKKGESSELILNHLFKHTNMQINYHINFLALVDGRPRTLSLKEIVEKFVSHRKNIITKRTQFELGKAQARMHILEGLKIALENIDAVIEKIKASQNTQDALSTLMVDYSLSQKQGQAILDMRLQRLTSMEIQKIIEEHENLKIEIEKLLGILQDENLIYNIIKDETSELKEKYKDDRKSEIMYDEIDSIDEEDLIKEEEVTVLLTQRGYIKRVSNESYKRQSRGGRGASSSNLAEDDTIKDVFVCSSLSHLVFFTKKGSAYWIKTYQIPEGSRTSRGTFMNNILPLEEGDEVVSFVALNDFKDDDYVFFATKKGIIKRIATSSLANAKKRGIRAITVADGDLVIATINSKGQNDLMLFSKKGKALRFKQEEIRVMGRTAAGNKGIRLVEEDDEVVSAIEVTNDCKLLLITEKGVGKRVDADKFNSHGRNTQGQKIYDTKKMQDNVTNVILVNETDSLLLLTQNGIAIRFDVKEVRVTGKNAVGVKMVQLGKEDKVISVARIKKEEGTGGISEEKNETGEITEEKEGTEENNP